MNICMNWNVSSVKQHQWTRYDHISIEIRPGDAEVELALKGADERTINSFVLADQIRQECIGKIPGAEIRVEAQSGFGF